MADFHREIMVILAVVEIQGHFEHTGAILHKVMASDISYKDKPDTFTNAMPV